MPQAFLTTSAPTLDIQATVTTEPSQEKVKLLVVSSSYATDRVNHELYLVGFAEVREWSKPLPKANYGEMTRILIQYVVVEN